ncbi:2-hydroxyacid dehydrogenase [Desulfurispira natronophila]|uniref:Lactate dehydrogenase-like 2-hydroxyacid dehydrogenase n=1 Tax=Desulfurispira natronophila TaxID=682562 RepID=A0A7W8DHT0_9BACT|nr:D-glycerate dehydrogenase [Desulfurispira natronophila]MBB5022906.1 lactate dehydrogenase-like 2-hydroxyacid dehydrogenase [Desulfurispira natronophila]
MQDQSKPVVAITTQLIEPAMDKLRTTCNLNIIENYSSPQELVEKAQGCEVLIVSLSDAIGEEVIGPLSAPQTSSLKLICNYAVGYNNIDIESATRHGVMVTNTPGVLTEATADIAFTLILSASRRLREGEKMVRDGNFHGWHPTMLLGRELFGSTLGIFGMGRIGSAVARRAAAFGMNIQYHNRKPVKDSPHQWVDFDTLISSSDFIAICAPSTPETRHRFTLDTFNHMKRTAVLVNVGRGEIIREKDLAEALEKGYIFAAGLDVYEFEPEVEPALLERDNVVLLPHLGSATDTTRMAMAQLCIDAITSVYHQGLIPSNCVNYRPDQEYHT